MTFKTFIEEKQKELFEKGFKNVKYRGAYELSKNTIAVIYDGKDHTPARETEVREATVADRTESEIKGLHLTFDVVKPRCRKSTYESCDIILL